MKRILERIAQHASERPRQPALTDAKGELSYRELQQEIARVSALLNGRRIVLLTGEDDDTPSYHTLLAEYPGAIPVSALTGYGIDTLMTKMDSILLSNLKRIDVQIPYTEGGLIAPFYELAIVESESHAETSINLVGLMHPRYVGPYEAYLTD